MKVKLPYLDFDLFSQLVDLFMFYMKTKHKNRKKAKCELKEGL